MRHRQSAAFLFMDSAGILNDNLQARGLLSTFAPNLEEILHFSRKRLAMRMLEALTARFNRMNHPKYI